MQQMGNDGGNPSMSEGILRFLADAGPASVSTMLTHLAQNGYHNMTRAKLRKKANRSLQKLIKNGFVRLNNDLYMVVPPPPPLSSMSEIPVVDNELILAVYRSDIPEFWSRTSLYQRLRQKFPGLCLPKWSKRKKFVFEALHEDENYSRRYLQLFRREAAIFGMLPHDFFEWIHFVYGRDVAAFKPDIKAEIKNQLTAMVEEHTIMNESGTRYKLARN